MSIPTLNFTWIAIFKDESIVEQFQDNQEIKFQIVKDKFNDLDLFVLKHKTKPLQVVVNLRRGLIFWNDVQKVSDDLLKEKNNIRLIFFRRHVVDLGSTGKELAHKLMYFIGYQYTDNTGRNKKVVIQLDQNGNMIIGD